MMRRRDLLSGTALAAAIQVPARLTDERRSGQRSAVRLGCQSGPLTDDRLVFFKRHGVEGICGSPAAPAERRVWTAEELRQFRDRVESHGLTLDLIAPPFLSSTHIDRAERPAIMLGRSPERDRDIEDVQTLIRNCASAGIPAIKYNLNMLGVLRTQSTEGRGGTRLSTWRLAEAGDRASRITTAGRVTAEVFWERITYFLERVIPVASEFKVRMACHPHDPGVPPGFEGVDCVLGTVEGLKKFITIQENPYHGLNFCQGTVSEMLRDPGREIFDVIRYFGTWKKIFNVHLRNIRGRRDDFQETFPDEGDVDLAEAVRVYREVGYPYLLMPDHVPHHTADPDSLQAFAFCYGYIQGLLQSSSRRGQANRSG